uniref:Uncharacterized protein n=1 Tax=Arundo donax TaxID=35708 RepID=A0A0A9GID0_ARUDO
MVQNYISNRFTLCTILKVGYKGYLYNKKQYTNQSITIG